MTSKKQLPRTKHLPCAAQCKVLQYGLTGKVAVLPPLSMWQPKRPTKVTRLIIDEAKFGTWSDLAPKLFPDPTQLPKYSSLSCCACHAQVRRVTVNRTDTTSATCSGSRGLKPWRNQQEPAQKVSAPH